MLNITAKDTFQLMKTEWTIPADFNHVKKITLKNLNLTTQDINWFLNELEWKHAVEIRENCIPLQLTVEAFIELILAQSNIQDKAA
ncbi:hypothetical protein [Adhaeribacter aquaticus]|uniref:hypothetical protein n=1 Tax=Adhaeribacter aquaticus TaxID=299567 RepID=UPI00042771E3|nr:hypothetical protein [Adhaeribacter aquaticus]